MGGELVDTNDQNQIGPPAAAVAVPAPVGTTTTTESSAVSGEQLDVLTALVETFADLVSVVREVDDRTRILERDRRENGIDGESPELKRIWVSAIEPLVQYLTQSVQVSPGAKPIQLADAAEQFAAWVATFKENAVGPDGQGLQQDPRRLAAFETKLAGVDPSPQWIEQEGQRLLIRPELDPATVRRTVAATIQSLDEEQERTQVIDQTLTSFDQEWEASVPPLEDKIRERRDELDLILTTPGSSTHLKEQAQLGLKAITAVHADSLVAARISLGQWVEKYRTDTSFTAEQVTQRINQELRPAIRQLQSKVGQLEQTWNAQTLRTKEHAIRTHETQTRLQQLDQAIEIVRTRYTNLVSLRRAKLGQQPDERFFGDIARLVNTAITDLGNLEADLLGLRSKLQTYDTAASSTEVDALKTRVTQLMKQSDDYADADHMERRLAAQAKAIEREQLRAAASERQRAKEAAKQAALEEQRTQREAKNELRRQQHQERQLRSSAHAKATQELRTYVTELTEAHQERQRHTETITALVASERQSLDEDRKQYLESKAERRALSASEATAWLAQLAERERLLDERQERLTKLTDELRALSTTAQEDRKLTSLRDKLASAVEPGTRNVGEQPPESLDEPTTDDTPVKIAIGRHT